MRTSERTTTLPRPLGRLLGAAPFVLTAAAQLLLVPGLCAFGAGAEPPGLVLTEVLFDVPRGGAGDANQDGQRDPAADEFVEVYNAGTKPVDIGGWTVADAQASVSLDDPGHGFLFVFPRCSLAPGQRAIVFGAGDADRVPGPVGTAEKAAKGNPRFGGARVFTAAHKGNSRALHNKADLVAIFDGRGEPVEVVWWGEDPFGDAAGRPAGDAIQGARRVSEVATGGAGSAQRDGDGGRWTDAEPTPGSARSAMRDGDGGR